MIKKIILFLFLCASLSAQFVVTENQIQQEFNLTNEAYHYLHEALAYMEEGSVNRKILDWECLKRAVYEKVSSAHSIRETYIGIELALSLLKDNHSFFVTPDQMNFLENSSNDLAIDQIQSKSLLIHNEIGYLLIPPCFSLSQNAMKEYAVGIQKEIRKLDKNNLKKWIIDLRGNAGGNMWPMVLGLKPLINTKTFGFFSDSAGEQSAWHFENQSVKNQNFEIFSLDIPSYQLNQLRPWIAVLVDHQTASSGEAATVAFLGGENTKIIGQPTAGYTSANELIKLSDGASIFLATAYLTDRLGRVYVKGITPDYIVEGDSLNKAIQWLQKQND